MWCPIFSRRSEPSTKPPEDLQARERTGAVRQESRCPSITTLSESPASHQSARGPQRMCCCTRWRSAPARAGPACGAGVHHRKQHRDHDPGVAHVREPARERRRVRPLGDFNQAALLHGEQAFELHGVLPVEGVARTVSKVTGMYDKGSAALVVTESSSVDATTGAELATSRSSVFIRGEGGFGGERGPSGADWEMPTRAPDLTVTYQTRPEQALLYRLTGDRNPLHSDPRFAAGGGLGRPILHGMCTYGFTGRALLHGVCGSDPARFHGMEGRFTRPGSARRRVDDLDLGRRWHRAFPDHQRWRHGH